MYLIKVCYYRSISLMICNTHEMLNSFMENIGNIILGLLCDLLWSDPDKEVTGWGENDRGVSYTFGPDIVGKFLHKHDFDLICRAHQVVEDGYEFYAKRQLVTLFSAPNYCGEFDNAGSMMSVDETLMCSFQVSAHFIISRWSWYKRDSYTVTSVIIWTAVMTLFFFHYSSVEC